MPYSIEDQINNDFDILLYDGVKLIHIATAGGLLPSKLNESDVDFKQQIREVYRYRRIFRFRQNDELVRDNTTGLENYFPFFDYMSKRGFYSYDKVYIDNIEDQTYQLICKPEYNRDINLTTINKEITPHNKEKYTLISRINLIETAKEFPEDFKEFNILNFI